jgi:hypothetical protein
MIKAAAEVDMPIVYVHGVANRQDERGNVPGWDEIAVLLRRYIAPVISATPEAVRIELAYWGKYGAEFRWNGNSRPRTKLRGAGTEAGVDTAQQLAEIGGLDQLPEAPAAANSGSRLTSGRRVLGSTGGRIRLRDLTPEQLSDVLCSAIEKMSDRPDGSAKILADEVAADPEVQRRLAAALDYVEELRILREELRERASQTETLSVQGASSWWDGVVDRASEVVTRVDSAPGYALSRVAVEFRGPINHAVTTFFGDVFHYMRQRDDRPGTIRGAVLAALIKVKQETKDPQEPFVVVSHSMGGQIVFDLASHFLAADAIRIDFWAAAASQIGLFEELKLLLASDDTIRGPNGRAAYPPNIGWWWNLWDTNDILSYTAGPIFELPVDDEEWDSGASLAAAHGAYLRRPSFYRRFAEKIKLAKEQNFNRP